MEGIRRKRLLPPPRTTSTVSFSGHYPECLQYRETGLSMWCWPASSMVRRKEIHLLYDALEVAKYQSLSILSRSPLKPCPSVV